MVMYGMKITITIPDEVYAKLEVDRGRVPRSTYIQDLISCFGGAGNITPSEMVHSFKKQGGVIPGLGTISKPKEEGVPETEKLVKKGAQELPSQDTGGFKTYFK